MPNFKQTLIQIFVWTVLMLAVGAVSAFAIKR